MDGVQQSVDTPTIERLGESLSGLPQPFAVTVYGNRISTLRRLSDEVTARLRTVPDLTDHFNNDAYPVTQLRIVPRPAAMALYGMAPASLYDQVLPAVGGEVLARVPQGAYHTDIYLRLPRAPDLGIRGLSKLLLKTASGWTPLGRLANLEMVSGPNEIRHIDGARALQIMATPTGPLGSTVSAARRALRGLHLPPGYRIAFGGLIARLEKEALGLRPGAVGALVLMTGRLLLQFDGLLLPGILLLEISAFTGGALALGLSGVGLNATGVVGLLTLVGISLNHDIVLLHAARRNEADGMIREDAVRGAGSRFASAPYFSPPSQRPSACCPRPSAGLSARNPNRVWPSSS